MTTLRFSWLAIGTLAASCLVGCGSGTGSDPDCEFGDGVPATLTVVDATSGDPIAPRFTEHGASIEADCGEAVATVTACKTFNLDLEPGEHHVTVSAIGYLPDHIDLHVKAPVGCSTDTAQATVELFRR